MSERSKNLPAVIKGGVLPTRADLERRVMRFRQASADLETLRARPVAPIKSVDGVTITARCAVTGREYATLYARDPDQGLLVPMDEMILGSGTVPRGGSFAAQPSALDTREFYHLATWPCPVCRTKLIHREILCGQCKRWTCTGRSYVDHEGEMIFVCHERCGARSGLSKESMRAYPVEFERVKQGSDRSGLTKDKPPLLLPKPRS